MVWGKLLKPAGVRFKSCRKTLKGSSQVNSLSSTIYICRWEYKIARRQFERVWKRSRTGMQIYSKTINHFGHPHSLDLVDSAQWSHTKPPPCSGCKTKVSGWTYRCSQGCNFFIHAWCALHPQVITHPAHFQSHHRLTLLPTPVHPGGTFKCDGCGHHGDGFSYRCNAPGCDFDLHMVCASRPLTATHRSHAHQLSLTFSSPYKDGAFSCDLCRKVDSSCWLYRCGFCNFDAHLGCVADANGPARIDYNGYNRPTTTPSGTGLVAGVVQAAVEGAVEGGAQQGAQYMVQNMTGDGETSYDAGDTGYDAGDTGYDAGDTGYDLGMF